MTGHNSISATLQKFQVKGKGHSGFQFHLKCNIPFCKTTAGERFTQGGGALGSDITNDYEHHK